MTYLRFSPWKLNRETLVAQHCWRKPHGFTENRCVLYQISRRLGLHSQACVVRLVYYKYYCSAPVLISYLARCRYDVTMLHTAQMFYTPAFSELFIKKISKNKRKTVVGWKQTRMKFLNNWEMLYLRIRSVSNEEFYWYESVIFASLPPEKPSAVSIPLSYCCRFWGSDKTLYASPISLNFCSCSNFVAASAAVWRSIRRTSENKNIWKTWMTN